MTTSFLFDFTFLLFTRKIKVINLKVLTGGSFEKLGQHKQLGPGREGIKTLLNGCLDMKMDYDTYRFMLSSMPQRWPRAQTQYDNDKTIVVFAFPLYNEQPLVQMQKTYAYLPVRSFRFTVLYDFLC